MIQVPVSVGELIDKLSILQVKRNKITNEEKLELVNKEYDFLLEKSEEYLKNNDINCLYESLVETNSKLWDIEDEIRVLESQSNFNDKFIQLARQVYFTNDERFSLKNDVNKLTNSEIREVKDYVKYK